MKRLLIIFLLMVLSFDGNIKAIPYGYGRAIFSVNVPDCLVTVDGKTLEMGKGKVMIYLRSGIYDYKITSDKYYHEQKGRITVVSEEDTRVTAFLKPAFGSIVLYDNEYGDFADANVFVDAIHCGKVPCTVTKVLSGTHSVRISKKNYLPAEMTVSVEDGKNTVMNVSLKPNYAPVTITTAPEAEITANGEKLGRGEWNGILEAGVYLLESNIPYYVSGSKEIEIVAGKQRVELTLPDPQPQYGSLKLELTPSYFTSTVYLDEQAVGKIPLFVEKVKAGGHNVRVEKKSDGTTKNYNCSVTVVPGQIITISESMLKPTN